MRVLVTGGSGYLGAAIVRELARRGHEPTVFSRGARSGDLPGVAIAGDIRDADRVRRVVAGMDAVCHTAALVSLWRRRPTEFDDVNVAGLQHVLDGCRSAGTARLVYTSSFLALPPAGSPAVLEANDYQRTKVAALRMARDAAARGMPISTIVPGVVYGPGVVTEGNLVGRLLRDHLAGRLPGIIGAARTWSFAHVNDVARLHVNVLECGRSGAEYIAGGVNAPQLRMFQIVEAITGRALPRCIPDPIAAAAGAMEELRARLTGAMPHLTRGAVSIFRHDWPLDSASSTEELGYGLTPLDEGIRGVLQAGF